QWMKCGESLSQTITSDSEVKGRWETFYSKVQFYGVMKKIMKPPRTLNGVEHAISGFTILPLLFPSSSAAPKKLGPISEALFHALMVSFAFVYAVLANGAIPKPGSDAAAQDALDGPSVEHGLPPPILTMFYRGTIKSVLSSCITAWFGNCTVSDRKTLQRIVRTAEKIIGLSLPSITEMYTTRCIRKANSIVDDPTDASHPSHTLFTLLPSGKRWVRARWTVVAMALSVELLRYATEWGLMRVVAGF
ncbi:hypothetical protein QTP86_019787, partial [Hemibagrus guttatus]